VLRVDCLFVPQATLQHCRPLFLLLGSYHFLLVLALCALPAPPQSRLGRKLNVGTLNWTRDGATTINHLSLEARGHNASPMLPLEGDDPGPRRRAQRRGEGGKR